MSEFTFLCTFYYYTSATSKKYVKEEINVYTSSVQKAICEVHLYLVCCEVIDIEYIPYRNKSNDFKTNY